ncbi:MAG: ABC transporter ATP-binding protein [SAR324 cluster bacterium]|nr:ABC transporter ATP-binding protein [SAR324 cluster bacterium]
MGAAKKEIVLKTEGLTKHFGGLAAVQDVNIEITKGQIHSVIGPNGAGKTTFFNLLTGAMEATEGKIFFRGQDITALKEHQIPHLGIARSFQKTNIFPALSVYDNAWGSAYAVQSRHPFHIINPISTDGEVAQAAREALQAVGLQDKADAPAQTLSHGEQRQLEVAIALAGRPTLLMLDEPCSGLSAAEAANMIKLLQQLGGRYTILLIEHNMPVVMTISDEISVLHFGEIIANGKPKDVQKNVDVKKAYLGTGA